MISEDRSIRLAALAQDRLAPMGSNGVACAFRRLLPSHPTASADCPYTALISWAECRIRKYNNGLGRKIAAIVALRAGCRKVGNHPVQEDIERSLRRVDQPVGAFKSSATDDPSCLYSCNAL